MDHLSSRMTACPQFMRTIYFIYIISVHQTTSVKEGYKVGRMALETNRVKVEIKGTLPSN